MDSDKAIVDALELIELPKKIKQLEDLIAQQQKRFSNPRTKTKVTRIEFERLREKLVTDRKQLSEYLRQLDELTF